jgi:hypothetical protein
MCWHRWILKASHLTVPLFDIRAKGELWECFKCGKLKAK